MSNAVDDHTVQVNRIFERLSLIATVEISSFDEDNMRRDILSKLNEGWTAEEIVSHMRNMEEVNPDKDEDIALAAMRAVKARVMERLGK